MVIFQKLIIGTTKEEYWSDQKVNLYLIFKFAEIFCDSKYSVIAMDEPEEKQFKEVFDLTKCKLYLGPQTAFEVIHVSSFHQRFQVEMC